MHLVGAAAICVESRIDLGGPLVRKVAVKEHKSIQITCAKDGAHELQVRDMATK
jgi:hypothetical protein